MVSTAEELLARCYAVRAQTDLMTKGKPSTDSGGVIPRTAGDALADETERDIEEYRDLWAKTRAGGSIEAAQEPPDDLIEPLWLIGWLIYEASWQQVQAVRPAFESLSGEPREGSETAARLVRRFAEQARILPWPHFAPRALGAIRGDALTSSKRDTAQGYGEASTLHREAYERYESYWELHGDRPDRERYRLGLQEVLLQLALGETGTACRTAERVIGRWSEELEAENPLWGAEDETFWVQVMFKDLVAGVAIGGRALHEAAEIERKHGFSQNGVTEERLALPTAFRNPGIMTARAALLVLALCPAMERLGHEPELGCETWAGLRDALLGRIKDAYRAIEKPVAGRDDQPVPLIPDHQRSLLQIRLNLALLVPGYDLPSTQDFVPCLAANPLDDNAVEKLSKCLAEKTADGRQRGDANVIGSAVMPAFIRSVEACRALYGVDQGYREWRKRWPGLDRYANEDGRPERVKAALGDS
jgi:hypothetical protein